MELLLNVFWVLLSVAGTCTWVVHRRNRGADRGFWLRVLVVSGCLAILLFPVISMTDDLYCDQFAMENASPTCKLVKVARLVKATAHHHHSQAATLLASAQNQLWQAIGPVAIEQQPALSSPNIADRSGRAPPFSL